MARPTDDPGVATHVREDVGLRAVLGTRLRLGSGLDPHRPAAELRATLIELCEKEMRANAKRSDDELLFPRRNLELLGEHGFLGLTVPEEYGGLGENHVAFAMTCETIARYGCASTAMCYVMHIGAVAGDHAPPDARARRQVHPPAQHRADRDAVVLRPGDGLALLVPDLVQRGALERRLQRHARRRRGRRPAASPTSTSLQTTSPDFKGYDDLSVFVVDKEHCEAQPSLWDALGLRGNQSGAIAFNDVEIPGTQIVGPGGRRRDVERRGRRPVVPDRLVVGLERPRARRDRHREAPHDAQEARRRRDARRRLPDDPGLRRPGGDGDERVADLRPVRRPGASTARPRTTPSSSSRACSRAATSCTGRGRSSSWPPRTRRRSSTRCSTRAAARATSATWSSSATSATRRPAG